jgi:hypothetical protein
MFRLRTAADRAAARKAMIPKGAIKVAPKGLAVEFYLWTDASERPCAMCFMGTAARAIWRHYFRDLAARDRKIADMLLIVSEAARRRAATEAKRQAPSKLEAGHIVRRHGAMIRPMSISTRSSSSKAPAPSSCASCRALPAGENSSMSGYVVPGETPVGPTITCRVNWGDSLKIDGHHASIWGGRPAFTSSWH